MYESSIFFDRAGRRDIFDHFLPQGGPLPKKMVKNVFLQIMSIWVPFERARQTELFHAFFKIIWTVFSAKKDENRLF